MEWLKSHFFENIYRHFLNILAASALTVGVNHYYRLEINAAIIILFNMAVTLGILLLCSAKNRLFVYLMLAAAALIGFAAGIIFHISYFDLLRNGHMWFIRYLEKTAELQIQYAVLIVLLAAVISTIIFYFVGRHLKGKALICIFFAGLLVCFVFFRIELSRMVIAFFYIYAGCTATEFLYRAFNQNKEEQYRHAAAFLLPVIILFILVIVMLPSDSRPIEWKGIKNAADGVLSLVEEISYRITKRGSDELFSLKSIGFGEGEKRLGGNLKESDRAVFHVAQHGEQYQPIYIVGSVKDSYTGDEWKADSDKAAANDDYNVDIYEKLYYLYVSGLPASEENEMFHPLSLTGRYDSLRSKSLFYPVNTRQINFWEGREPLTYVNGNLFFHQVRKREARYTAYMIEWNMKHPVLLDYLRSQERMEVKNRALSRDLWIAETKNTLFQEGKDWLPLKEEYFFRTLPALLKERQGIIEEHYKKLPAHLPRRVYELAEEITESYKNDYDKINAIKAYLLQFDYSINPGKVPEKQDFVDYFLFQGQRGYCTYFATSMAVLSRCIGLPSRYVEGFMVNPEIENEKGDYVITSANAHAWAEIYLEGFGWMMIEATPGYDGAAQTTDWARAGADAGLSQIPEEVIEAPEIPAVVPKPPAAHSIIKKQPLLLTIPVVIVLGFVLLLILIFFVKKQGRIRKYKKSGQRERIYLNFAEILFYLSLLNYQLKPGETISGMLDSIKELEKESGIFFEECFQIFIKARYSYLAIADEEVRHVAAIKYGLKKYMHLKYKWIWLRDIQWVFHSE